MNSIHRITAIICFANFYFVGCDQNNDNNSLAIRANELYVDTFYREIPLTKKGEPAPEYILNKVAERKFEFMPLDNGFDSIQIRVSIGYTSSPIEHEIIIKKDSLGWSTELYTFTSHYTPEGDSLLSITKDVVMKTPKSGWYYFASTLFKYNILTLPDYRKIPGYIIPHDGSGINIQVATKNMYRMYLYPLPIGNSEKITQAKYIEQILELFEKELDFKPIRRI